MGGVLRGTLALVFAGAMFAFTGPEFGGQFIAGWVTEYSLSIDNLFVFIIIMARFSVPRKYQQEVLMVGIIIALILRGIFIMLGAIVIEQFSWVFYIFGAFLLWTAWKQAQDEGEDEEDKENPLIARIRKIIPMSEKFDGGKLRTDSGRQEGLHPDADRLRHHRHDRPALRRRLHPGHLRPHPERRSSSSPRTSSP